MKTKIILGDEHLLECEYDPYNIRSCHCMRNDDFAKYFVYKYPNHLASIAYRDIKANDITTEIINKENIQFNVDLKTQKIEIPLNDFLAILSKGAQAETECFIGLLESFKSQVQKYIESINAK